MLTAEYLNIFHIYSPKADVQFRNVIDQADELLRADTDINLNFPVNIDEHDHTASWHYLSTQTDDEDEDDDEDEVTYLFHSIYIGLRVTTKTSFHSGGILRPFLTAYIGADDGDKEVELFHYGLDEELNMEKIANDIAATTAMLRELETCINNMNPQRAEIAKNLMDQLFDR